jgi:hypothetical protein
MVRSVAVNLVSNLSALGEYERAQELCEETLARQVRVSGEDHPDALVAAINLANNRFTRSCSSTGSGHRVS